MVLVLLDIHFFLKKGMITFDKYHMQKSITDTS